MGWRNQNRLLEGEEFSWLAVCETCHKSACNGCPAGGLWGGQMTSRPLMFSVWPFCSYDIIESNVRPFWGRWLQRTSKGVTPLRMVLFVTFTLTGQHPSEHLQLGEFWWIFKRGIKIVWVSVCVWGGWSIELFDLHSKSQRSPFADLLGSILNACYRCIIVPEVQS